jgi:hypothetical protein
MIFYPYVKLTNKILDGLNEDYQYFEVGYINFEKGKKIVLSLSDCIDFYDMISFNKNITTPEVSMHSIDNYIHFFTRSFMPLKWENEFGISLMSLIEGDPTISENKLVDI